MTRRNEETGALLDLMLLCAWSFVVTVVTVAFGQRLIEAGVPTAAAFVIVTAGGLLVYCMAIYYVTK
jgi:hypothetical protein